MKIKRIKYQIPNSFKIKTKLQNMSVIFSDEEIKKIAFLSRLSDDLSDKEIADYKLKLSGIINIANELKEVDVTGIAATDGIRTFGIEDLREDTASLDGDEKTVQNYKRVRQNILKTFGSQNNNSEYTNYENLLSLPGIFAE